MPRGVSSESMVFSSNGTIGYKEATGNVVSLNQSFGIYQFNNPAGLEKMSGSKLAATAASGNPMLEGQNAGLTKTGVYQGYIEADEMVNMIIAQRAYELNSKAITTSDSMLETANNLKR